MIKSNIEIKQITDIQTIALSHTGINGIDKAFERLIKLAMPTVIKHNPETKIGRIFYDSFKDTAPDKVRMGIFLTTNTPLDFHPELNQITIKKGKYVVGHFEIGIDEFEQAWKSLFNWTIENAYKISKAYPFEIYHNNFREHPEQKFIVDFFIPVV